MGIGMFRRNYDEQPVALETPASTVSAVEVGEPTTEVTNPTVSRAATKADLKEYLVSTQGSELTAEQELMTKAELVHSIFGSEA
jgi:hypothetical protein